MFFVWTIASAVNIDSNILSEDYNQYIDEWTQHPIQYELLYRGSRDGFEGKDFHRMVDDHKNTLTVIKSQNGNIFGGFTDVAWDSSKGTGQFMEANELWLFTLKNPYDIPPTKISSNSQSRSIYYVGGYSASFGKKGDLTIRNNCDISRMSNNLNFPYSFIDSTGKGNELFDGQPIWKCEEVEVFSIHYDDSEEL
ncbi:hypothetical protein WA158_008370 [Blastocystis sp. Blastoise]